MKTVGFFFLFKFFFLFCKEAIKNIYCYYYYKEKKKKKVALINVAYKKVGA